MGSSCLHFSSLFDVTPLYVRSMSGSAAVRDADSEGKPFQCLHMYDEALSEADRRLEWGLCVVLKGLDDA